MGMYTELLIKCNLKTDLPEQVDHILNYLFNSIGEAPEELPDHQLFKTNGWKAIGRCSSYYHIPTTLNYYKKGYLFSRSDLKNYGNEIDLFIDWIKPYITEEEGNCIGWKWYEEWNEPELIYVGEENDSDGN